MSLWVAQSVVHLIYFSVQDVVTGVHHSVDNVVVVVSDNPPVAMLDGWLNSTARKKGSDEMEDP